MRVRVRVRVRVCACVSGCDFHPPMHLLVDGTQTGVLPMPDCELRVHGLTMCPRVHWARQNNLSLPARLHRLHLQYVMGCIASTRAEAADWLIG